MKNLTITEVSHVTTIAGVAKFRTPDGVLHELQVGDILQPGMEILLGDASNFAFEKGLPEAIQTPDQPADQQPTMPAMGAANGDQTTAQITALQQAILSGQDPTQAFEAAAAGIAADAGGAGPGSGNDGFISIARVGDSTIAESGYDTTAPTADQLLQIDTPAAPTANNPTIVTPDTNTIAEDTVATGNVLANDSDTDSVLSVAGFTVNGANFAAGNTANLNGIGTLVINPDGGYVFTPVANWNGTVPQVTYTTNTGASDTLDITVNPVNDPPVDGNEAHSITEDSENTVVTGNALLNASDIDGDTLTVTSGIGEVKGTYGTLILNANGEYTYTLNNSSAIVQALNEGDKVYETFAYTVSDGHGGNVSSNIIVEIIGKNDIPTIEVNSGNPENANDVVNESGLSPDGTEAGVAVLVAEGSFKLGDADGLSNLKSVTIDGTEIQISELGTGNTIDGAHGTLTITGFDDTTGDVTYSYLLTSPVSNAADSDAGVDKFSVTVTDNSNAQSSSTITIDIVDDKPLPGADSASVTEDGTSDSDPLTVQSVTANVMTNDVSGADAPASFVVWTSALTGNWGVLTDKGNGSYIYTLNNDDPKVQALTADDIKTDSFTYTMKDADGDVKTETLTVTIHGTNDIPTIEVNSGNPENANDVVNESGLSPDGTEAGVAVLVAEGSFKLGDADGLSNLKSVTIDGTEIQISELGTGNTIDGAHGTLTITGFDDTTGDVTYSYLLTSPVSNAADSDAGVDKFSVTVTDNSNAQSSSTITIDIVDDKPLPGADSASVTEDGTSDSDPLTVQSVTANVMTNDVSGADAPASFVVWTSALTGNWGVLTDKGNGSYIYTLNNDDPKVQALTADDIKTDSFTYTMKDADGDVKTETLTVTIHGTNDIPTIEVNSGNPENANDVVNESGLSPDGTEAGVAVLVAEGSFKLGDADGLSNLKSVTIDGTEIQISELGTGNTIDGAHGTLTITGFDDTTGDVTYSYLLTSPVSNAADSDAGVDKFSVTVTDNSNAQSSSTITIDIVDDKPTFTLIDNAIVANDEGVLLGTHNLTFGADGEFRINLSADTNIDGLNYSEAIYKSDGSTTITAGTGMNTDGTVKTDGFFVLTINPDGTYKFDLLDSRPSVPNVVDFTQDPITGGSSTSTLALATNSGSVVFSGLGADIWPTSSGFGISDGNLNFDKKNGVGDRFSASFYDDSSATNLTNLVDSVSIYFKVEGSSDLKINWYTNTDNTVHTETYRTNGFYTIDPVLDFSTIYFEVIQGTAKLDGFSYSQNLLPDNQTLSFDVSAIDGDGDTSSQQQLDITLLGGVAGDDISGTSSHDAIMGTAVGEHIFGLGGDDILTGGEGNDVLDGGDGSDTASYVSAVSAVAVNLETGIATGGDGTDALTRIENIIGSQYNDALTGDHDTNNISGGAGNDTLIGGLGNDILTGGTGADIFKWTAQDINTASGAPFSDTITDFSRTEGDKLDLSDVLSGDTPSSDLSNYLTFSTAGSNVVVSVHADGNSSGAADMTIVLEGQAGDLTALENYLLAQTNGGIIH